MKKLGIILVACGTVAACTSFEPDMDKAAEIRKEAQIQYHEEVGCPMVDDHEAYRNCVIKTYDKNTPKTFVPARLPDGRSVAILRNEETTSYDEQTGTYETERVVVIETVETIAPTTEAVTTTETTTTTVEEPAASVTTTTTVTKEPVTQVTETVTTTNATEPTESVTITTPVTETEPTVVEEKEQTWWDTYQKDKPATKPTKPQCPCPDPNEPCPQCVDK